MRSNPAKFPHHDLLYCGSKSRLGPLAGVLATMSLLSACADDNANDSESAGDSQQESGSTTDGSTSSSESSTGPGTTAGTESSTSGSDTGTQALTYWDDVAPIYFDKCVSCHHAGGPGSFPLDNYADAKRFAGPSADAVANGRMPPWFAQADGQCGTFAHDRSLSPEEIGTIQGWAQPDQLAEGTPRQIQITPQDKITDPLVLKSPNYIPRPIGTDDAKWDDYRCFLVDPEFENPTFITGYGVQPGNKKLVHHVILFSVDASAPGEEGTATNAEVMQALDDDSPDRLGWPCFGFAGEGVAINGVVGVWAPGQGDVLYPDNSGLVVDGNTRFVAQFHYNFPDAADVGEADQTSLLFKQTDTVEKLGMVMFDDGIIGDPDGLPPGQPEIKYIWDMDYTDTMFAGMGIPEVDIWGFMPHMHEVGKKQTLEMIREDGGTDCLTHVERWDFDWQHYYMFDKPVHYTFGDTVRTTCNFDTSGKTEPVFGGWGTENEMCTAIYYASMEFPEGFREARGLKR